MDGGGRHGCRLVVLKDPECLLMYLVSCYCGNSPYLIGMYHARALDDLIE